MNDSRAPTARHLDRYGCSATASISTTGQADTLGLSVDELFPHDLYRTQIRGFVAELTTERFLSLTGAQRQGLLAAPSLEAMQALDEGLDRRGLKERLASSMESLTPRENKVLAMRFGLEDDEEHSLADVATFFQVTPERVRQIEAKALRKMRNPLRSRPLKPFIEVVG